MAGVLGHMCCIGESEWTAISMLLYNLGMNFGISIFLGLLCSLFSSMVTYGIPFIALGWGVLYGEQVTSIEIGCLGIILAGVFLANR